MTDFTLLIDNEKLYFTPLGFYDFADDFYQTGIAYTNKGRYSPVPFFLFCRSIELSFKAYLLARKYSITGVKKLGHDLIRILNTSNQNGFQSILVTTENEQKVIEYANKYYKSKGFEYFSFNHLLHGHYKSFDLSLLKSYSLKVLEAVHPIAKEAVHKTYTSLK
jgi:hypothetical protein